MMTLVMMTMAAVAAAVAHVVDPMVFITHVYH